MSLLNRQSQTAGGAVTRQSQTPEGAVTQVHEEHAIPAQHIHSYGKVTSLSYLGGLFAPMLKLVKDTMPDRTVWTKMFGPVLHTKDIENYEVDTNAVLFGTRKRAVLVFFSAKWCPPNRDFTRTLLEAYSAYDREDVEVIFVSEDNDQSSFDEYYGQMPWKAVPFSNQRVRARLSSEFGPRPVPMLVVFKGTGELATTKGVLDLNNFNKDLEKAVQYWNEV